MPLLLFPLLSSSSLMPHSFSHSPCYISSHFLLISFFGLFSCMNISVSIVGFFFHYPHTVLSFSSSVTQCDTSPCCSVLLSTPPLPALLSSPSMSSPVCGDIGRGRDSLTIYLTIVIARWNHILKSEIKCHRLFFGVFFHYLESIPFTAASILSWKYCCCKWHKIWACPSPGADLWYVPKIRRNANFANPYVVVNTALTKMHFYISSSWN